VPTKLVNKFHKRAAAIPPLRIFAEEDDAALVTAAKCGSSEAFEVLVRRYQARILSVAWRFTRNREDAEDITQQTFQKAFVHLRQFEGNSSFSTWLTRIAMNEALMWLRRKRASHEVPIEESTTTPDEPALPLDFPDPGPSPEDSCLQREREQILSAAMNELTPAMRKAIELRELGELSVVETARVMRLSVQAVKGRAFHGRRKLREVLNRYVDSTWMYGSRRCERAVRRMAFRVNNSSAAHGIRAGTKGGSHSGVSVYPCIGDLGIPVFHRTGRRYRHEAPSLS
jgi:RNA polymerase sigma-70 factor (ECF subfamily)